MVVSHCTLGEKSSSTSLTVNTRGNLQQIFYVPFGYPIFVKLVNDELQQGLKLNTGSDRQGEMSFGLPNIQLRILHFQVISPLATPSSDHRNQGAVVRPSD